MVSTADPQSPLLPASPTTLNARHRTESGPLKRKRNDSVHLDAREVFTAKVLPPARSTLTFRPVEYVFRAHLPLAWINLEPPVSSDSPQRLLLQLESLQQARWEHRALVAQRWPQGGFYAIEKVDHLVFVAVPLHDFVTENVVRQAAIGATPLIDSQLLLEKDRHNLDSPIPSSEPSAASKAAFIVPNKSAKNHKGAAARLSILHPNDCTPTASQASPAVESLLVQPVPKTNVQGERTDPARKNDVKSTIEHDPGRFAVPVLAAEPEVVPIDSAIKDDVLDTPDLLAPQHLRHRYLETLYLSRTSLAYYTKGPLSRSRARARAQGSSMCIRSLADFYRDGVLTSKKMELKYRDSIPQLLTSSVEDDALASRKSRRKPKSLKLRKDGLWSIEDDFVTKWWKGRDSDSTCDPKTEMKQALAELRMRETEMQVILMLEILALDSGSRVNGGDGPQDESQLCANAGNEEAMPASVPLPSVPLSSGKQQKRNLEIEIEMLADRLCIWHSVGSGQLDPLSMKNDGQHQNEGTRTSKDRLRAFCSDVVIPFYNSKLPETCAKLCKSLGGPIVRPQASQDRSQKPQESPSLADADVSEEKDRKTPSQRHREGLPNHLNRGDTMPPGSRSVTLPSSMGLRREPSELSQRPMSRGGIQKSVSFSHREVDLVADASVTASKRRKLEMVAAQKRELEAAIHAVKKPNRNSAGKAYMDAAEQRGQNAKRVHEQAVQISATPRRGKSKILSVIDSPMPSIYAHERNSYDAHIPSSTATTQTEFLSDCVSRSSAKRRAVLTAIYDTPSKGSSRFTDLLSGTEDRRITPGARPDSTLFMSSAAAPTRALPQIDQLELTTTGSRNTPGLAERPRGTADIPSAFTDLLEITEDAGRLMNRAMGTETRNDEVSIYETLGWNDDDDDAD